jgi:hypothetical protein
MAGIRLITQAAVQNPTHLMQILNAFADELSEVRTLLNEIKTDLNEHTHGGVTTGSGSTSAGPTIAASAVTQKVQGGK